jgi:hypothetical protein
VAGFAVAGFAVTAGLAGWGFAARERAAPVPLIPAGLRRSRQLALGLAGAMGSYLVLFGPLVLVPQLLARPGGEAHVGLLLTALPVGFGIAALGGQAAGPGWLGTRGWSVAGAVISTLSLAILAFVPLATLPLICLLALAGLGLGIFVPANNAAIMRTGPAGSAATLGGLVNMARGIGTTLGIALVTLTLHLAGGAGGARAGFAVLAAAGVAAAATALASRPGREAAAGQPADGRPALGGRNPAEDGTGLAGEGPGAFS